MSAQASLVSSGRTYQLLRDPAAVAFASVEAAAFVAFVAVGRLGWFNGDEWDFLAARSAGNLHDLFQPHNVHWSTLPLLAYRFLWATVGLRSYLPYVALVVGLHLLTAALLRRVMIRADVAPWIATVAASAFALFGTGYFNIVYPFQIGFDGALVFGIAQLLLADHKGALDRRDWFGLGCGLAGLMCSGVGVAMIVAVGVAALIGRGRRFALFHAGPLAVIYLIWFAVIGRTGDTRHSTFPEAIRFAGHDVWATFVAIGQYGAVAGVLVAVLIAGTASIWATRQSNSVRRAASPIALAAAAAVFVLITGAGRGFAQNQIASRYLHVTAALLMPVLAVAADLLVRRWRVLLAAVVPLFLVGIPGNLHVLVEHTYDTRDTSRVYQNFVLTLPRLPIASQLPRSTRVDPLFDPWITIGWLLDGVRSGRIPRPGGTSPDFDARQIFVLALRPVRAPVTTSRCVRGAPGQTLRLVAADKLAITGVVRLRYLAPLGRAFPPVSLGSFGERRAFVVVARSVAVRVVTPTLNARLSICRPSTGT